MLQFLCIAVKNGTTVMMLGGVSSANLSVSLGHTAGLLSSKGVVSSALLSVVKLHCEKVLSTNIFTM